MGSQHTVTDTGKLKPELAPIQSSLYTSAALQGTFIFDLAGLVLARDPLPPVDASLFLHCGSEYKN